jgi:four helix bundle protein
MKYERFEDLPVWQTAIQLAEGVILLAEDRAFDRKGDLRGQLQAAAISVSNNIAEGFERGTTNELLTFLYISRGSAGETRSMLHLCDRLASMDHLRSQIAKLRSLAESCSKQLRGWADSLQNSDIKGPRHLNDRVRRENDQQKRAVAFIDKLQHIREQQRREQDEQQRDGREPK